MITLNRQMHGDPVLEDVGSGYDQDILARLDALLEDMNRRHSKVLFVRFDIRFPQHMQAGADNTQFVKFLNSFTTFCRRKKYDPAYLWVREQNSGINQHYHCLILLDGQKIQHYYAVLCASEKLWGQQLNTPCQSLVHFCDKDRDGAPQRNGLMIRKDKYAEEGMLERCLEWGKYLAKNETKGNTPSGIRSVGNSRIPQDLYLQKLAEYGLTPAL